MDLNEESIALHAERHGKISIASTWELRTRKDLSLAYTPGVAAICMEIARDPRRVFDLTCTRNTTPERVLPDPLDSEVAARVGQAVATAAADTQVCR